jgi:hypothetical protein
VQKRDRMSNGIHWEMVMIKKLITIMMERCSAKTVSHYLRLRRNNVHDSKWYAKELMNWLKYWINVLLIWEEQEVLDRKKVDLKLWINSRIVWKLFNILEKFQREKELISDFILNRLAISQIEIFQVEHLKHLKKSWDTYAWILVIFLNS